MRHDVNRFPLAGLGFLHAIFCGGLLAAGLVTIWTAILMFLPNPLAILLGVGYLTLGLLLAAGGAVGMVHGLTMVHLTPEGIVLTLFGRPYRQYAAKDLKAFALVQRGISKNQTTHLCISLKTPEELALVNNPDERTRRLAAQRHRATWQEALAAQYLRRRAKVIFWSLPGKDLVFLSFHMHTLGLLRLLYPQIPWLLAPESQSSHMLQRHETDPAMAPFEDRKKELHFREDGIHLKQRDNTRIVLEREQIRSIICLSLLNAGGGFYQKFLLLTHHTPEELMAQREAEVARQFGPDGLDTLRQIAGWEQLALCESAQKLTSVWTYCPRNAVNVPWFAAREDFLRQLYPDAQYVDCSNEAIFDAIMKTGTLPPQR